ncbi:MAG: fluoride efflux transporter FluC [Opitutales bacterium]
MWIGLGTALGAVARYGVDRVSLAAGAEFLAVGTLAVNVSGSLFVGWVAGRWAAGGAITPHPYKWHFWMTGVCGGYTTFSAFAWQVLEMVRSGQGQMAGLYAAGSVGFGMLAVWLGLSLAMGKRPSTD